METSPGSAEAPLPASVSRMAKIHLVYSPPYKGGEMKQ